MASGPFETVKGRRMTAPVVVSMAAAMRQDALCSPEWLGCNARRSWGYGERLRGVGFDSGEFRGRRGGGVRGTWMVSMAAGSRRRLGRGGGRRGGRRVRVKRRVDRRRVRLRGVGGNGLLLEGGRWGGVFTISSRRIWRPTDEGGFWEGGEGDGVVVGVEETVEGGAAGLHAAGLFVS